MTNPLARHYAECNTGSAPEKLARLPDFPRIIDVELTNRCNFTCLMCPTGNKAMRRSAGMMTAETFARIVSGCAGRDTAIRFIGWGEPLMHKGLTGFVRAATARGVATHINTNGSYLNGDLADVLAAAGLGSIKFSFQGVDRISYREARNIDFFGDLVDKVAMMWRARDHETLRPWIQVSTSTTYETDAQVERFRQLFEPYADEITVGKTIFGFWDERRMNMSDAAWRNYDKLKAAQSLALAHPDPCPEVYDKLTIAWDGTARVCCNDFDGVTDLGNVQQCTLRDIWHHPTIEEYRARLAEGDYSGPLCSVCFDYMDLTEGVKE